MPLAASGSENSLRSPAKYASSWRLASTSTARRSSAGPSSTGPSWNSTWVIAPSAAVISNGPTGVSIVVEFSHRLLLIQSHPYVHQCVGPPRPPGLGSLVGLSRGALEAELGQPMPDPEIGGHEDVGVAQGPQRDVVRGPGPDAGQREQRIAGLVPIGRSVEDDVACGHRSGQGAQRSTPSPRHRQLSGSAAASALRSGRRG